MFKCEFSYFIYRIGRSFTYRYGISIRTLTFKHKCRINPNGSYDHMAIAMECEKAYWKYVSDLFMSSPTDTVNVILELAFQYSRRINPNDSYRISNDLLMSLGIR